MRIRLWWFYLSVNSEYFRFLQESIQSIIVLGVHGCQSSVIFLGHVFRSSIWIKLPIVLIEILNEVKQVLFFTENVRLFELLFCNCSSWQLTLQFEFIFESSLNFVFGLKIINCSPIHSSLLSTEKKPLRTKIIQMIGQSD